MSSKLAQILVRPETNFPQWLRRQTGELEIVGWRMICYMLYTTFTCHRAFWVAFKPIWATFENFGRQLRVPELQIRDLKLGVTGLEIGVKRWVMNAAHTHI